MKAQFILAAAAILSISACNNANESRYEEPSDIDFPAPGPEANPTPGQQLDTAIQDTKDAARRTKEDVREFGQDVKDKTKEIGQDIKESAEEAKAERDR